MSSTTKESDRFELLRDWYNHLGFSTGRLAGVQSQHSIDSSIIPELFEILERNTEELRMAKIRALEARNDSDRNASRGAVQQGVSAILRLLDELGSLRASGFSDDPSLSEDPQAALGAWVDQLEESYGWIREAKIDD